MQWETVIGLEIHIQLSTGSKAFCSDSAQFSNDANTQISIISLAHPGALPKLNKKQIEFAIRLGLSMNSEINLSSYFERKQYFYPDLPKGYQISQQASPICIGGHINLSTSLGDKKIRLHHIHMEEDAGKSVHDTDPKWSKIDLNRAGVPLLEMVTEPDFRNAEEVTIFLTELQRMVRYLDISDANMEEGSMRCDVNISVRPMGSEELRERCEVKNVNSRRFAKKAIEYEVNRQIKKWENGEKVVRQTLQYVPEEDITVPIREKESAHDYRYFPDPDLPPIVVSQKQINEIKSLLPSLPQALIEDMVHVKNVNMADAQIVVEDKKAVDYLFDIVQKNSSLTKLASNWIVQTIIPYAKEKQISFDALPFSKETFLVLLEAIYSDKITSQYAKELWHQLLSGEVIDLNKLISDKMSIGGGIDYYSIKEELFAQFPAEADDYKKGKTKLIGFFLGEAKKKYPQINIKELQKIF